VRRRDLPFGGFSTEIPNTTFDLLVFIERARLHTLGVVISRPVHVALHEKVFTREQTTDADLGLPDESSECHASS